MNAIGMRMLLMLLALAVFAPSAALAAPNVTFEITNKTEGPLFFTSVSSQCVEIPYKTTLPAKKLTSFRITVNSSGRCAFDPSKMRFEIKNAADKLAVSGSLISVLGSWQLIDHPQAGFCVGKNGYDQLSIAPGC